MNLLAATWFARSAVRYGPHPGDPRHWRRSETYPVARTAEANRDPIDDHRYPRSRELP